MNDEQIFDMIENLTEELAEKEERIIELEKQLAVADDTIAMIIQSKIRQITNWTYKQENQDAVVSKIQSVFESIKETKKYPFNKKRKYNLKLINTKNIYNYGDNKYDILMLCGDKDGRDDKMRVTNLFTSPIYHLCKLDKQ